MFNPSCYNKRVCLRPPARFESCSCREFLQFLSLVVYSFAPLRLVSAEMEQSWL